MKEHTSNFETEIKTYGRQQAVQVIYEQDGQEVVLDNENVFSATPNFKASLLKSAMKSLILNCSVEIPVGTRLQFKYGILVGNDYEYLNYGYYIVNKVEKKEDARSYEITCYDKMMLAMVDYIDLEIEYPITIRNYIAEICNHLEIDFGSNQDQFVNYDKEIPSELYLDANGNSLGYTFRDVLDELAQVTASVICIDENDNLVVKYPQLNGDYETIEGTSLYIENADDNKIDLELKGNTTQNGTPTPSTPVPVNNVTGEQVVRVCGKNILYHSVTNRTLNGLTLTINDDRTVTVDGTATANTNVILGRYTLKANTNYYLSGCPSGGSSSTYNLQFYFAPTQLRDTGNGLLLNRSDDTTGMLRIQIMNGTVCNNLLFKPMLEQGTSATTYEPYQGKDYEINLGNIELNKIGDYQDFIRKGTGKNLLEPIMASATLNGVTCTNNGDGSFTLNGTATAQTTFRINQSTYNAHDNLKNYNGTYTFSCDQLQSDMDLILMQNDTWLIAMRMNGSNTPVTANVNIDNCFIYVQVRNGKSVNNLTIRPMLEKGTATYYEPYGYKDKWYIEKNVGKVVLNGSESGWSYPSANRFNLDNYISDYLKKNNNVTYVCDSYIGYDQKPANSDFNTLVANVNYGFDFGSGNAFNIRIKDTRYTSIADFKSSLQTNNVTLYYVLANTTYTLIENEELIEQLDRIYLQQGLNNVLVNGNLPSSLKMTYVSDLIGIDEEQLKDINVNFGEKYGPINSLVIARAADSDFIYKEDEKSVAEDGLCEVKISDNQILNGDNRTQFIDEMFNQLRGTEFYLNDFSSTGITYLDLLDYYIVKVFDNSYKCLMLNDEIDITQGLQEQVFTERPKESETEYKSLSKQDQSILRTGIKVNKVEGEIQSVVEQIGDRSQKTTTITQDIDGIEEIVQDYQDLTETKYAIGTINFENVNRSVPIYVRIHPTYTDIVGVVPSIRLYPSNSLYPDEKYKALHFYNVTEDEDIIYRLPCNLYYLNSNIYDEFIIDFDKKKCYVIQRVQVTNGIKTALQEEQIIYFSYPDIALTDGDYSIYVISDSYVEVKLMKQNDFTKQFATEVEMQSSITMTNRAIQLEVEQRQRADENLEDDITAKLELKVDIDDNDQVVSMINASADYVTIDANKLNINGVLSANGNFEVDTDGNMTCNDATIDDAILHSAKIIGGDIQLTGDISGDNPNFAIYYYDTDNNLIREAVVFPRLCKCK